MGRGTRLEFDGCRQRAVGTLGIGAQSAEGLRVICGVLDKPEVRAV